MPLSRRGRLLLAAAAVLAGGFAALALVLPRFLDIERYRPYLAAKVQEATGRTVSLGPMTLRLLPVPSLVVRTLAVSEGPRYPGRDALRAEALSVRLRLRDLLRGRVGIRSIVLDRPTLVLIRDARGRWNYDELIERARAARSVAAPPAASRASPDVVVGRIEIRSGTLQIYDDAIVPGSRSEIVVGPVDASIGGWGSTAPADLDLAAGLGKSVLRARATIEAAGDRPGMEVHVGSSKLEAADLARLLPWLGVARPGGLQVGGGIVLEGDARVPLDRPEAMRFRGTVRLDGLSYKDASLSKPVSGLAGTIAVDGDRAVCQDFTVKLGASSITGSIQATDFLNPRIGFALTSPKLDLDEVIATLTPSAPAGGAGQGPAGGAGGPASLGMIDRITARGTVDLGAIRFQGFDLTRARATVGLERRTASLGDLQAALYGGRLEGSAKVDLGRAPARYVLGVSLADVEIDPLLTAYDAGLKNLMRGRVAGRLDLEAAGASMESLARSARGTCRLEAARGAVKSVSVLAQVAALLEMAGGKGIGRQETEFEWLRGSLAVAGGEARTEDLALHAADLDLAGAGAVGLDGRLDLACTARLSEESTQGIVGKNPRLSAFTDQDHRLVIRLGIGGSLASPKVSLDTRGQTREMKEKARDRVKEELRERLKRLLSGAGEEEKKPE